jgi:hypothetical protein
MRNIVKIPFEHKGYSFVLTKETHPNYGNERLLILYRLATSTSPYWRLIEGVNSDETAIEESKRIIDRVFKDGNPFNPRYTHFEVIVDTLKMRAGSHTRNPGGTNDVVLKKGNVVKHRTDNWDGEGFYEYKGESLKGSASQFAIWNEDITPV